MVQEVMPLFQVLSKLRLIWTSSQYTKDLVLLTTLVDHCDEKGANVRIKGVDSINKTEIYGTDKDLYLGKKLEEKLLQGLQ